jgi:hypothetical protein
MRKILLNKCRSKESINKTNYIPVELDREMSLYHDEILSDTIDTLKVYNNEKDTSKKHRFIFTMYPICTNVLFNKISEIVYREGSNDAQMLTNKKNLSKLIKNKGAISTENLTRLQAIRNTEYSNKNFELTYHCGLDMFNNHLLRTKEDITVQKKKSSNLDTSVVYDEFDMVINSNTSLNGFRALSKDVFNTIGDVSRSLNGKYIYTYLPSSTNYYTYNNSVKVKSPLYLFDTIKTFDEACKDGIKRQDGWVGFTNPSSFRIPIIKNNDSMKDYYVNRCINNKESCEFIDLAPERDLFSFTPKKNNYRKRIEKNWDYFLTYPYKSVYNDPTNSILKGKKFGITLVEFNDGNVYKDYIANNGVETALFRSPVKHNLKIGDSIYLNFGKIENMKLIFKGRVKCTVVSLGYMNKDEDRCFSVRKADFEDYINLANIIGFNKVVQGGYPCEYYFRLFKKFNKEHDSVINRLAFAGTIYGDDVTQIVFTDDIDISDYKDNLGRPLTEIYLTIIKTNRGHKTWYEENINNSSDIEYSHVFGKVTSGLDLPDFVLDKTFPTVRFQHNIDISWVNKHVSSITINKSSSFIESNIDNSNDVFYGDLVEFNPMTLNETILENVYHRFNTAQREITNNELYNTLYYDEIAGDIYDANTTASTKTRIRNHCFNDGYANLAPEGYVYQPHHKIKIGQFEKTINQGDDSIISVLNQHTNTLKDGIEFNTIMNYTLLPNDVVSFMNDNYDVFKFIVDEYTFNEENSLYTCKAHLINMSTFELALQNLDNCIFYKHNLGIPEYAHMLPDGSGRHLWKNLQPPSEWSFTDDLYTTTFTNGAFYHHQNITFPVKRQDPFRKYNMILMKDNLPVDNNYEIPATELDNSNVEYVSTNNGSTCF